MLQFLLLLFQEQQSKVIGLNPSNPVVNLKVTSTLDCIAAAHSDITSAIFKIMYCTRSHPSSP